MASTSTAPPEPTLESALSAVPTQFRGRLIKSYRDLKSAYSGGQHDACGLRVGRFCEIVLRFLQDHLTQAFIPFGTKIQNFDDECKKLEKSPKAAGPEDLRVIMPRALAFLYTLRNKRGIGHEGAEVDANEIDAATMVRGADWCLCELIREFHKLPLEDAQSILDAITDRQLPDVWSVAGKKRVLRQDLNFQSMTLLLLYSERETSVAAEDLCSWTEHSNLSNYRRDVLKPLHAQRLIEYDEDSKMAILSPTGIAKVEDTILKPGRAGSLTALPPKKRGRRRTST
jgi:hypothetical protein